MIKSEVTHATSEMANLPFRYQLRLMLNNAHLERVLNMQTCDDLLEFALKEAFSNHPNIVHILQQCRHELNAIKYIHDTPPEQREASRIIFLANQAKTHSFKGTK